MSGTKAGGEKARNKILKKFGEDWFKLIGRKGGKKSSTGGFASYKVGKDGLTGVERARIAGRKGGQVSKRGKTCKQKSA